MDDSTILGRIRELVTEERELRNRATGRGLDDESAHRLRTVEEYLDQCWDLLRQRRAKREFSQDPDEAQQRPTGDVESYLQ